ncbi:glucose PTS transporter subunit EIIB [Corynebacterium mendelii]|uniref:PTS glucose/sucrose transporter subunit IIB n=1 Tax=Corynebacterium mendelii TaxID=2765362 RepID=A0A939DZN5_9CORY|nr:PTS glucose/sucrose transporter subunit IIB [Corynebacterium mendelii]MBN9643769.1 PTS glucose/sucrose transporter subunit IIB [Corynebacterium mendelii]
MAITPDDIVAALGGPGNIRDLEGCITRLRTVVVHPDKVDEDQLYAAGAKGVISAGTAVQVVVGPEAELLADLINDFLD